MKKIVFAIATLIGTTTLAQATPAPAPLLLKVDKFSAQDAPAEKQYGETCYITGDQTYSGDQTLDPKTGTAAPVVSNQVATVFTATLKDVAAVQTAIEAAKQGTLSAPKALATSDVTAIYTGLQIGDAYQTSVILQSVDKSGNESVNETPETQSLIEFADANCATPAL